MEVRKKIDFVLHWLTLQLQALNKLTTFNLKSKQFKVSVKRKEKEKKHILSYIWKPKEKENS
jgi:hypothetical protein